MVCRGVQPGSVCSYDFFCFTLPVKCLSKDLHYFVSRFAAKSKHLTFERLRGDLVDVYEGAVDMLVLIFLDGGALM